jgi:hypothetical protein
MRNNIKIMFPHTTMSRVLFSLIFTFAALFGASAVSAATYEVTGFGWGADNNEVQDFCRLATDPIDPLLDVPTLRPTCTPAGLGWISFSNKSDSTAIPYGVFLDSATGDFSGYAWSSNIGWVTFNPLEMQKCSTNRVQPTPPSTVFTSDNCPTGPAPKAHMDITTDALGNITGGTGKVTGWARACAVFVSGCSGTVRSDISTGTWDGWISLSGVGYGLELDTTTAPPFKFKGPVTTGFFSGTTLCETCYAWGGSNTTEDAGFGWGMNLGGLSVSLITASLSPLLSFWADQTTLASGQSTDIHWITSSNLVSCTASGSWSGPKPIAKTVKTQSTGPLTSSQIYNLQCFGPDTSTATDDTSPQTVNITVMGGTLISIDGVCGSAAGVPSRSAPVVGLCSAGNATTVTKDTTGTPDQWRWDCNGINGGSNVSCSTDVKKAFRIIQF